MVLATRISLFCCIVTRSIERVDRYIDKYEPAHHPVDSLLFCNKEVFTPFSQHAAAAIFPGIVESMDRLKWLKTGCRVLDTLKRKGSKRDRNRGFQIKVQLDFFQHDFFIYRVHRWFQHQTRKQAQECCLHYLVSWFRALSSAD